MVDVSIIASAKRPQNWMEIYNNVKTNLSVEFVFVGPVAPSFKLPGNFRFIHSKVKPTQCIEIARLEARGNFLLFFADDLLFSEPFAVDALHNSFVQSQNPFNIASSRFIFNGKDLSGEAHRYDLSDPGSPVMPVGGLMLRESLNLIGGIDRNFIGVCYDLDVAMRMYEAGGKVFLTDVYVEEHFKRRGNSFLFMDYHLHDRAILDSLWVKNGKVGIRRSRPVEGFASEEIAKFSQGPRGHWRGNELLLKEIWDSKEYYLRSTKRRARSHLSLLKNKLG
jgi:GT2 family glycosyltransferase